MGVWISRRLEWKSHIWNRRRSRITRRGRTGRRRGRTRRRGKTKRGGITTRGGEARSRERTRRR